MLEEGPVATAEALVARFFAKGAHGWRTDPFDLRDLASLPRIRVALLEIGSDHVDENGLLDVVHAVVERAVADLRRPLDKAAQELLGFTRAAHGQPQGEREELAAKHLRHGSARWMRGPNRRYEGLSPTAWLIKQITSSLMLSGKPLIAIDSHPDDSTVPTPAVARLRLSALGPDSQRQFYEAFLNQAPRFAVPRYLVAPASVQQDLQQSLPVDTAALRTLLDICGIRHSVADPPLTTSSYDKLRGRDEKWAQLVKHAFEETRTEKHVTALRDLYDYLSCQEHAPSKTAIRKLDVVIVAGARRAMNYRLDELLNILYQCAPTVILAGLAPLDQTSTTPISEADAMLYYLREERNFDASQLDVILDHRATDITEALQHALGPIREKAHFNERPVHVGLITGPYQMRRMYYIAQRCWASSAHAIASISPLPSGSSIDLRVLLDQSEPSQERRTYGFRVFIQEYIKLIGGRVVAEL